jgi:hypothetical protein
MIGGGRTVRCAQCGNYWAVTSAEAPARREAARESAPPPPAQHELAEAMRDPANFTGWQSLQIPEPPRPDPHFDEEAPVLPSPYVAPDERLTPAAEEPPASYRNSALAWAAWAASIAVLLLLLWAGYAWRAQVMQAWPASERLYAALGLRAQE